MAQEFTIKSPQIEEKINQLLPSQGGQGAGVDFSASTMVVPIVNLTETAEGSSLRQDLQTSYSYTNVTEHVINNQFFEIVNTTGYYRVFGTMSILCDNTASRNCGYFLFDGTTSKRIIGIFSPTNSGLNTVISEEVDFNVKIDAGKSLYAFSSDTFSYIAGSTRQIADLQGNLINP